MLESSPIRAWVLITADNGYELFANGSFVGSDIGAESHVWQSVERYDITSRLTRGRNVLGISGTDLGGVRGVIAAVRVEMKNGRAIELVTDRSWRAGPAGNGTDFSHPEFVEGADWGEAREMGRMGMSPWGELDWSADGERGAAPRWTRTEVAQPGPDFVWPEAIGFLADDCSVYVPLRGDAWGVAFRIGDWSRAYTEFDLPCPSKIGRKLFVLQRNRSGAGAGKEMGAYSCRLLVDAGAGVIGSPSVTFDGQAILAAMARVEEKFFHIYRIPLDGGPPQRLTDGPFHDIDPAELPDGRIVFASTRIGTFEEYHQPPSRALFRMNADGSQIQPITSTLIFDNEPEVMADGRIVFVRTDNFFDRGKVETHLHSIRPDGTDGLAEVAANVGPEYGSRLRTFGYGSPAPLPDGRLAFISNRGNGVAAVGAPERSFQSLPGGLGDLAPMPDGRLLCTVLRPVGKRVASDVLGVIDLRDGKVISVYESAEGSIHSPVFIGARSRPPVIPDYVDPEALAKLTPTGFLFCHNARFTTKTKADWSRIRAIRVLGAAPLTTRSSHSHIVHVGHETVELGTVPLAADGSFSIEVPADMPLALQAVDAEGRPELNEMSWLYVRPGERRSCTGCHQPREAAPPLHSVHALALQRAPVKLLGQGDPHRSRGNNPGVTGLMDLQFDRFRECASLNRNVLRDLPEASRRDEIAMLIRSLQGTDPDRKISSAQRLGLLRERQAAAALAAVLIDTNREVRLAAVMALASCGTRDSAGPLLELTGAGDPVLARAAEVALENLTGHTIPTAEWKRWFSSNSWTTIETRLISALNRPEGSGAKTDANRQPSDGGVSSIRAAVVALGHIGSEAGRAALERFVRAEAKRNPYPIFEKDNRTDTFTFSAESSWNPRTLQEAVRALGHLGKADSLPFLRELLAKNIDPRTGNLFLAEAVIEAVGRIGTAQAEQVLLDTFGALKDYWQYVGWYSDHPALYACHSSPLHARLIEALDAIGSTRCGQIVPQLIRSVPTDPDRGLFLANDDYEILVGRLIRRSQRASDVLETCLALLGDSDAKRSMDIEEALSTTHPAWAGHPGPANRAAHILSLLCRDRTMEPRIRAAFVRYWEMPEELIERGLGNPTWTPVRHWTLFYLGRALGNLKEGASVDELVRVLSDDLNEARHGRPDPSEPEIHLLQFEYTPCWRAAAAWALGEIGDARAFQALLGAVRNLDNAVDVRHAAAVALGKVSGEREKAEINQLARDYPEVSVRKALQKSGARTRGDARVFAHRNDPK